MPSVRDPTAWFSIPLPERILGADPQAKTPGYCSCHNGLVTGSLFLTCDISALIRPDCIRMAIFQSLFVEIIKTPLGKASRPGLTITCDQACAQLEYLNGRTAEEAVIGHGELGMTCGSHVDLESCVHVAKLCACRQSISRRHVE